MCDIICWSCFPRSVKSDQAMVDPSVYCSKLLILNINTLTDRKERKKSYDVSKVLLETVNDIFVRFSFLYFPKETLLANNTTKEIHIDKLP